MNKALAALLSLLLTVSLAACSNTSEAVTPSEPEDDQQITEEIVQKESFSDLISLYQSVCSDAEISVHRHEIYLDVTMVCPNLSAESQPETWAETISALASALEQSHALAEQYGVQTVAGVIALEDGTVLASGMNGKVAFDAFHHEDTQSTGKNPPTITKHEYNQISVGMSLSEVREIIGGGGELQTQVGEAGITSITQTYRWYGEHEPSYADILFDNFKVYSKIELWLE